MSFCLWSVPESELMELDPKKARDLIVECFYQAQRETFARAKERAKGAEPAPEEVRETVLAAVKAAFREAGQDFEAPTKESLSAVVHVLARKAMAWGTPDDIVQHHGAQIMQMIERL